MRVHVTSRACTRNAHNIEILLGLLRYNNPSLVYQIGWVSFSRSQICCFGPKYAVWVPNMMYWSQIWCLGPKYDVWVPNMMYLSQIWCMGPKYDVLVPNMLHWSQIWCINPKYDVWVPNMLHWSQICCFGPNYAVLVPNLLYLSQICCIGPKYDVFVPNMMYWSQIYHANSIKKLFFFNQWTTLTAYCRSSYIHTEGHNKSVKVFINRRSSREQEVYANLSGYRTTMVDRSRTRGNFLSCTVL